MAQNQDDIRIIKKYPNRRLYDTKISSYIKLDDVHDLVSAHKQFQVIDSKTQKDITRSVLMQIINEREDNNDRPVFTTTFLRNVISSYGNNMEDMLADFFDRNLTDFVEKQHQIQEKVTHLIDDSTSHPIPIDDDHDPIEFMNDMVTQHTERFNQSWNTLKISKSEKR